MLALQRQGHPATCQVIAAAQPSLLISHAASGLDGSSCPLCAAFPIVAPWPALGPCPPPPGASLALALPRPNTAALPALPPPLYAPPLPPLQVPRDREALLPCLFEQLEVSHRAGWPACTPAPRAGRSGSFLAGSRFKGRHDGHAQRAPTSRTVYMPPDANGLQHCMQVHVKHLPAASCPAGRPVCPPARRPWARCALARSVAPRRAGEGVRVRQTAQGSGSAVAQLCPPAPPTTCPKLTVCGFVACASAAAVSGLHPFAASGSGAGRVRRAGGG